MWDLIVNFFNTSGIAGFFASGGWRYLVMMVLACVLLFLAIKKKFEPYLLLPIAFGMLLINIPYVGQQLFIHGVSDTTLRNYSEMGTFLSVQGISITPEQLTYLYTASGFTAEQISSGAAQISVDAIYQMTYQGTFLTQNAINAGFTQEWIDTFQKSSYILSLTPTYSGLIGYLYYGVKWGIYPCLIFLCIGATTDFGPLIANKKTMLLGAAAQIGIFVTFIVACAIGFGGYTPFTPQVAASIGIIGGADGPTAILVTSKLAPEWLGSISIAAYSYMALVPVIFPPIIKLLTTKKERGIVMEQSRPVSKTEKILFPIIVAAIVILIVPSCAPLIGCLMLGNLIKESGVVPKITETLANSLMYIVTILLGFCVGSTAVANQFLTTGTLMIFGLGIAAFIIAAASGVLFGKLMCVCTKGKINPMIGAAGVSAVPMAARVVHDIGRKENPNNYLLMHAMGPNVAGVIGSAVAAGVLLSIFGM